MPVVVQGERMSVAETEEDAVHQREVAGVAVGQCAVAEGAAEAPSVSQSRLILCRVSPYCCYSLQSRAIMNTPRSRGFVKLNTEQ